MVKSDSQLGAHKQNHAAALCGLLFPRTMALERSHAPDSDSAGQTVIFENPAQVQVSMPGV
jgi:hypothetical protein